MPDKRRAVITGIGAITPLGVGARPLHEQWAQGVSGITSRNGQAGGYCDAFDPADFLSVKEARRLDRFAQLAVVAADEAVADAGWSSGLPFDPMRIGLIMATGIGGFTTVETNLDLMREKGPMRISPLGIPMYMPNAAAAAVSMRHGIQGQAFAVASACASSGHAVGLAARMIQYGDADAVVTGGAEATLTDFGFGSFNTMQALSKIGISCPFDARRDGFIMGEGAGVLVLEEYEQAKARGATILGEVAGYGSTSDAHHLTAPEPTGRPAAQAITLALQDAGLTPDRDQLRQRPRNLDRAQRRRRDRRAEARPRRARLQDPGVLDQVGDRPSARRRRRGRGGRDRAGAERPAGPADAQLRGS